MSDETLGAKAAEVLLKGMDPERRESGLRLDRNGVWHHESTPVTHERLARALTAWLDHGPEPGRYVLRPTAEFWAWVDVEDAPFQAALTDLAPDGGLCLLLSDGREEVYRGPTIRVGDDDAWYVPVRDGSFEARLGRGAMAHLAEYLQDDEEAESGVALQLPGGLRIAFAPR